MANSYPRRDQARGIWKINDITKNIKEDGTYPGSSSAPSGRALIGGGFSPSYGKTIDFVQISTTGNATDFGDLSVDQGETGCISNFTRAIWCGGNTSASPNSTNVMDYVSFATLGNAADFGDLGGATSRSTGVVGNNTRGVVTEGSSDTDQLQFINPATLGNATDFGNLSQARQFVAGMTSITRGLFAGGFSPTLRDTIDFIEITSTGDAVDFGNLVTADRKGMACSSHTKGVYGGGLSPTTVIQSIGIGSLGDMVNFGNLSGVRVEPASTSDSVRGIWAGGQDPSVSNVIEKVEITTAANATDFGDLSLARYSAAANSNAHGGLDAFQPRAPELYSPTGKVVSGGLGVGDIGLFQGGEYGYTSVIDYIQISSTGNGVKFGDLNASISAIGGTGNSTRFLAGGGQPGFLTQIQYGAFSTKGNSADYGDLTTGRDLLSALGNETRGVWGGGRINPSNDASNVMDYITISTLGNATDFGDLTVARGNIGGNVNSSTRGIFHGGYAGADSNVIDYITIGSTGNATDFGDLTRARQNPGGFSSTVRGVMGGGFNPGTSPGTSTDIIDYITIASTGNATDFGDLAFSTTYADGVSNNTRGVFSGLNNPSAPGADGTFGNAPQILYVTIASTGNTTLFGELTARRYATAPASNGHGGLS